MAEAITYDDVLLVPSYNHWESRRVVDISVLDKSEKLKLELPIMTSNMDTITEVEMADYIGEKGGTGVLHRFMDIDDNVAMFKACKYPTFVSIGCTKEDLERAGARMESICADLARTGRVCAVSMGGWDPELDSDGRSRKACISMLAALLGG